MINFTEALVAARLDKAVPFSGSMGIMVMKRGRRDFECGLPHLGIDARIVFDDATDYKFEPQKLIDQSTASGDFEVVISVNKTAVIRKRMTDPRIK
ncbi:MAG: hypothetical protein WBN83_05950 [Desulfoprunum sp.]|jgi:hypothetical protein|uniref:hypothetical protein n=1 Tax=Desulfoprunum sp. TaxID=2020866 RepID=UPI00052D1751|nr:hypothetical protein JT06_14700 [Desulfobulbus sp. Tol-SR]